MSLKQLFAGIGCEASDHDSDLSLYASNYGNMYQKTPGLVLFPNSTDHILEIMRVAGMNKMPYTFRGAGHSLNNSSLSDSILIICRNISGIQRLDEEFFEVDAAIKWAEVEVALNKMGRSFPVLTSELATTVGGTISSGGFGEGSVKWGSQIHLVSSLELVLPKGEIVRCSPKENQLYFRFALAGLGQLGYISKVVLKTIPYLAAVQFGVYMFDTLTKLVAAIPLVVDRMKPDYLSGRRVKDYFELIIGFKNHYDSNGLDVFVTTLSGTLIHHGSEIDFPIRSLTKHRKTTWDSEHVYIFCDNVIPHENAAEYAFFLQKELNALPDVNWRSLVLAGNNNTPEFPLLPVEPSSHGLHVGFGLYLVVHSNDLLLIGKLKKLSERLVNKVINLNGRPYLTNTFCADPVQLKTIYKDSLHILKKLKYEVDPFLLCNNNFLTKVLI